MEKKQSSVEWLANNLDKYMPVGNQIAVYALLEQAKAMHKEEIEKAWMAVNNELQRIAAEKYYNETFDNGKETK